MSSEMIRYRSPQSQIYRSSGGGRTCKITLGNFFGAAGRASRVPFEEASVDTFPILGSPASAGSLRAEPGWCDGLPSTECASPVAFFRSRSVIDLGATTAGGFRGDDCAAPASSALNRATARSSQGSIEPAVDTDGLPPRRFLVAFSSYTMNCV